jgi:hypothetical protein
MMPPTGGNLNSLHSSGEAENLDNSRPTAIPTEAPASGPDLDSERLVRRGQIEQLLTKWGRLRSGTILGAPEGYVAPPPRAMSSDVDYIESLPAKLRDNILKSAADEEKDSGKTFHQDEPLFDSTLSSDERYLHLATRLADVASIASIVQSPFPRQAVEAAWSKFIDKPGRRPFLHTVIARKSYYALMDEGAKENVISKKLYDRICLDYKLQGRIVPTLEPDSNNVSSAARTPIVTRGRTTLDVYFAPTPVKVDFLVCENLASDIILGQPFKMKYVMEHKPQEAYLVLKVDADTFIYVEHALGEDIIPLYPTDFATVHAKHSVSIEVRAPLSVDGEYRIIKPTRFYPNLEIQRSGRAISFNARNESRISVKRAASRTSSLTPQDEDIQLAPFVPVAYAISVKLTGLVAPFVSMIQSHLDSVNAAPSWDSIPAETKEFLEQYNLKSWSEDMMRRAKQAEISEIRTRITPEEMRTASENYDLSKVTVGGSKEIPSEWVARVHELLREYAVVLSFDPDNPSVQSASMHDIEALPGATPFVSPPHRLPPERDQLVIDALEKLVQAGLGVKWIGPLPVGAWSSPVFPIKQKGKWRVVYDMRRVNDGTRDDPYPMLRTDEFLYHLMEGKLFDLMDMPQAYMQTVLTELARKFCFFSTSKGFYQLHVMPWGLKNAPSAQQRLVNNAFSELKSVKVYLDDIANRTIEFNIDAYLKNLEAFLKTCVKYNIRLSPAKCKFLQTEVEVFRFKVKHGEFQPLQKHIEPIFTATGCKDRSAVLT